MNETKIKDIELFSIVRDFLTTYLPEQRKSSSNTVRAYKTAINQYFKHLTVCHDTTLAGITMRMITRASILSYLDTYSKEFNWDASTRNHRLNCLRAFLSYAADVNLSAVVCKAEAEKVPLQKKTDTDTEEIIFMSEKAVTFVLNQPDTSTVKGLRDFNMLVMLYDTGARIQELLNIKLNDLSLEKSASVKLHGKGGKSRIVPLMESTVNHLKNYMKVFHPDDALQSDAYLFYVVRDNAKKRMTEDNARKLIKSYGTKARLTNDEVPENVHPHLFRHTRAMHLYQNGMDLMLISQWLGHAQFETTKIYARADTEMKRKAIENASGNSALNKHTNAERYKVDDEAILRKLMALD
jgi:integrase/recombinase XerD